MRCAARRYQGVTGGEDCQRGAHCSLYCTRPCTVAQVLPAQFAESVWFRSGFLPPAGTFDGYWASPEQLFVIQMTLMGIVESARLAEYVRPGSYKYLRLLGLPPVFAGCADSTTYPGGPAFNPLAMGDTPGAMAELKLAEIKHGRLAMMAMLGFFAQAAVTGQVRPVTCCSSCHAHATTMWHFHVWVALCGCPHCQVMPCQAIPAGMDSPLIQGPCHLAKAALQAWTHACINTRRAAISSCSMPCQLAIEQLKPDHVLKGGRGWGCPPSPPPPHTHAPMKAHAAACPPCAAHTAGTLPEFRATP